MGGWVLTLLRVNRTEPVVTHLVHKTVEQDLGTTPVNTELSRRCIVIMFLDVPTFLSAASNTDHPQELVDI